MAALVFMTGAGFAAVPLYRLFCQVTGFGGTVMRAESAPDTILDRTVRVRFDTNVRDLPWAFQVSENRQTVRIGETGVVWFRVTNTSDHAISGTAAYNVTPDRAGPYFQKLECFCFEPQEIAAGETREFPIMYFIAPEMAVDREGRGLQDITLSYTFYPAERFEQRAAIGGRG